MKNSFFHGIRTEDIELSTGEHYELPVRYFECSFFHALFPASAERVRQLLPSGKLVPLLLSPRRAVISLMAMEYRQIAGASPYNEFMVGVPVQYQPRINIPGLFLLFHPLLSPHMYMKFGVYVRHLPVTTQESQDIGREIWGYPKTVAEIIFEDEGRVRRCRLRSEGTDVVTLEIQKPPTSGQAIDLYSYTMKDNQLLRTKIQTRGHYGISRSIGGAWYTLGQGPIAAELGALRMGKKAIGCFYAEKVQSMLHPPTDYLPL